MTMLMMMWVRVALVRERVSSNMAWAHARSNA